MGLMIAQQEVLCGRCQHPQSDHANGKCAGLGHDKDGKLYRGRGSLGVTGAMNPHEGTGFAIQRVILKTTPEL